MSIYFDQAATSFPKAPGVGECMADFIQNKGVNVGRGAYSKAYGEEMGLLDVREAIARLFNATDSSNVVFTSGVTQALNTALRGLLEPGDNVLITPFEHNAVTRPLNSLKTIEVTHTIMPTDGNGIVDVEAARKFVGPDTKAIAVSHASNLTGLIQPLKEIGKFARENGLLLIVDSAQSAGVIDIDMVRDNIDVLCFTGHKSLLGPQGIGGMVLADGIGGRMKPLLYGGTGSFSELELMPERLPDKFEAGTLNLPGIFGLGKAIEYISSLDLNERLDHEQKLADAFEAGVRELPGYRVVGKVPVDKRVGIVSVTHDSRDISEIAFELDKRGVMIRSGLHCAPLAHKTLGTFPTGALRFSFGESNTLDEVKEVIDILKDLDNEKIN